MGDGGSSNIDPFSLPLARRESWCSKQACRSCAPAVAAIARDAVRVGAGDGLTLNRLDKLRAYQLLIVRLLIGLLGRGTHMRRVAAGYNN